MTGQAADRVREAESRQRVGDSAAAIQLLEDALHASVAKRRELPGWLCGRLAALYRTVGRYDDEVHLLERYRDSQTSEEARTRYDARLSKARTIAERKRRNPSGALDSVRASIGRPRTRRPSDGAAVRVAPPALFTGDEVHELSEALASSEESNDASLAALLEALCQRADAVDAPVERLVEMLKLACVQPQFAALADEDRAGRYGAALIRLLALYFREDAA
jgi:hypothetical protein